MTISLNELIGYILLAVIATKGLGLCSQHPRLVRHLKQGIVGLTIFMAGVRIGVSGAFLDTVIEAGYGSAYKSVTRLLCTLSLTLLACGIVTFVLVLRQGENRNVVAAGFTSGVLGWASAATGTYDFVVATGSEISSTLNIVSFCLFVAALLTLAGFIGLVHRQQAAKSDLLHAN